MKTLSKGFNEEEFYGKIELTPEEITEALLEGKKRKYFREKHKAYWEEMENSKDKCNKGGKK